MTKQEERVAAAEQLRNWLKPGDTVHTVLRHVSRSGMSRSISLVVCHDGEPFDISYWAARAMGNRIDQNKGGIKIDGAGMDMGFALVYNLAATLYALWDCLGTKCPSSDHSNGDRNYSPLHTHKDGGYALRHRWL